MRRPAEVAASHAYAWGAHRLVAFEEIGLPQYILTLDLLLQEKKAIPAIEEFVLRAVDSGLQTIGDVGGLLGLDARLTQDAILNQLDAGALSFDSSTSTGRVLRLTHRGNESLRSLVVIEPTRRAIQVAFDRITMGLAAGADSLLRPRDLGCRSLPGRSKEAPKAKDLSIDKVAGAIARAEGGRARRDPLAEFQLLDIRHVVRAERRYRLGVLLIYERNGTLDYGVTIDDRPSSAHTAAVGELGGLAFLEIDQRRVLEDTSSQLARSALPPALRSRVATGSQVEEFRRKLAERLAVPASVRANVDEVIPVSDPTWAAREVTSWEAALLFIEALRSARRRILIASSAPIATSVDYALKQALEDAAMRGVEVHLLIRRRPPASPGAADPIARLREASAGTPRITLHEVEDPPLSTLVWDDNWVAGGFPWLGQHGRDAGLLSGTSVLVTDPAAVDSAYQAGVSAN